MHTEDGPPPNFDLRDKGRNHGDGDNLVSAAGPNVGRPSILRRRKKVLLITSEMRKKWKQFLKQEEATRIGQRKSGTKRSRRNTDPAHMGGADNNKKKEKRRKSRTASTVETADPTAGAARDPHQS
ncbi:unnamed protein product [Amoebophrya sp. A25]|nr:unnamed protein product [Amoebophrya sp. A25]|eukprot:GSA25T00024848001.1